MDDLKGRRSFLKAAWIGLGLAALGEAAVVVASFLKPRPVPAAMLDARPAYCLVLEDSPNGLRAGRDAGMKTIMVPDLVPYSPELAPVCDAVFPDLSHVPAFIENLSACR